MPGDRAGAGPHPADSAPEDYLSRVNRAIDFVLANLHRAHTLDDVARAAHFSPFHFHRVFRAIVGETPAQFTRRLRLERAIRIMSHEPGRSLTDVALDCGFASSSDFSRAFKQRYGVPPSVFDVETWRAEKRGELQMLVESADAGLRVDRLPAGENPDGFEVTLRALPARRLAYRRVLDPYREGVVPEAAERLVAWAKPRGLTGGTWYGYMWDDPEVVELERCRYDVGVELAPGAAMPTPSPGEPDAVGVQEFPPMLVAEVWIDGGIDLEMRLLDWIYRTWLPSSGHVPDDLPAFEVWAGLPFEHGLERFELAIHLPVRRG